jgi:hypothetical protein
VVVEELLFKNKCEHRHSHRPPATHHVLRFRAS